MFGFWLILLLAAFNIHYFANGDDIINVERHIIQRNTYHPQRILYQFHNSESVYKLAEMLVKATLDVHFVDSSVNIDVLEKLANSFDKKLALPLDNHHNGAQLDLNVFFKSWAEKKGKHGFDALSKYIIKQFRVICGNEIKYHPNEQSSLNNICELVENWLYKKTGYYSKKLAKILENLHNEFVKKWKKDSSCIPGFSCLAKAPTEENVKAGLENEWEKNTMDFANKDLYYYIYKYALAYLLISQSQGKPMKGANILTAHKPGMTKREYLIYWLYTIMNQMYNFKLVEFDPIDYFVKEKEKDVQVYINGKEVRLENRNAFAVTGVGNSEGVPAAEAHSSSTMDAGNASAADSMAPGMMAAAYFASADGFGADGRRK